MLASVHITYIRRYMLINNKYDLTVCSYLLKYLQFFVGRCDNFYILQARDLYSKVGLAHIV